VSRKEELSMIYVQSFSSTEVLVMHPSTREAVGTVVALATLATQRWIEEQEEDPEAGVLSVVSTSTQLSITSSIASYAITVVIDVAGDPKEPCFA
jgi:uncharacterized protein (DUF2141 family)